MSSNRSKPADRGAAAPKPSRKVALDEVLRTLQDLVQHDLDVDSLPSRLAKEPLSAEVPQPTTAEPAPAPESTPIDTSATVPIADTIVLETPATPPDDIKAATDTIAYTPAPDGAPPAPAKKSRPARRATDRGVQQELPLLDVPAATTIDVPAPEPTPTAKATEVSEPEDSALPRPDSLSVDWSTPAAEPATTRDAELGMVADELPSLPATPVPAVSEPATPHDAAALAGADDSLNDIPVLEDAVDFHHEPPADTHPIETAPAGPALPSANAARRLAIQVAARINVTLRKEGKAVLSSELIARLAHELEEALAKGASNMENKGPEKP